MQITPVALPPNAALPAAAAAAPTQIAAHRGFHDKSFPYENSMDAFRGAIAIGADLAETDIRRTADGVLVLHHDSKIGGHKIGDSNFADLPLLPDGQRVGTLQELVDLTASSPDSHTKLLVETKEHGYEQDVVSLLSSRLRPDQFELMSFDNQSVRALRELAPTSRVGALYGAMPDWESGTWPITGSAIVERARALDVDFVGVHQRVATDANLDTLADAGIDVSIWTVNEDARLSKWLHDPRVHTVITDHPDRAQQLRDLGAQEAEPLTA